MTQEALAARLDTAPTNYQRIESGKQNLQLRTLERIATELGTTVYALIAAADPNAKTPAATHAVVRPTPLVRLSAAGYRVRPSTMRGRRPVHAVPVMTLRAAAGAFADGGRVVEALGWVILPRKGPPPERQFVAQIEGDSMEPRIPDGAVCLFGPPAPPPFRGRAVLVAHPVFSAEGLGGPFALKMLETRRRPDGTQRVTLRSLNPRYAPVVIDAADEHELRVIADLVEVLVPKPRRP
ncbi:MAG: LexA family transcriptional regulator [Labilithrix sp.]|nr:LexA family transcriptional regulator [Labilithrix sp.]MCW5812873.1 LexA family transcriptional regulator [Labilithrix sp.]